MTPQGCMGLLPCTRLSRRCASTAQKGSSPLVRPKSTCRSALAGALCAIHLARLRYFQKPYLWRLIASQSSLRFSIMHSGSLGISSAYTRLLRSRHSPALSRVSGCSCVSAAQMPAHQLGSLCPQAPPDAIAGRCQASRSCGHSWRMVLLSSWQRGHAP